MKRKIVCLLCCVTIFASGCSFKEKKHDKKETTDNTTTTTDIQSVEEEQQTPQVTQPANENSATDQNTTAEQAPAPQAEPEPQTQAVESVAGVANWKDSKEAIIQKEGKQPDYEEEGDQIIGYMTTLNGNDVELYYYFDASYGCYKVRYYYSNLPYNYVSCKSEYDSIVNLLTQKYGNPVSNEEVPVSELADYSTPDVCYLIGYIYYDAVWNLPEKNIDVFSMTEENQPELYIDYTDPNYTGQGYVSPDTNGL